MTEQLRILFCDTKACYQEFLKKSEGNYLFLNSVFVLVADEKQMNEQLKKNLFDLIFMNIDFDGVCSIEIAQRQQPLIADTKLIFMTETWKHITEVYRVPHLCYLKKEEMHRYLPQIMKKILKERKTESGRLMLKYRSCARIIDWQSILYIERSDRKTYIYTKDKVYDTNEKLDDLGRQLGNEFLRCHYSYIVNMYEVKWFTVTEVILRNGNKIPVSRPHKNEIGMWFEIFSNPNI